MTDINTVLSEFREYLQSLHGKMVITPDHNAGIVGFITASYFEEHDDEIGDIIIAVMYEGWKIGKPELWITFKWPIQEAFQEDSGYAKFITKLQVGEEHPDSKHFQDWLTRVKENAAMKVVE